MLNTLATFYRSWRQVIGTGSCTTAIVGAVLTPAPMVHLMLSPEFAADADGGTHTADYSSAHTAAWLAAVTVVAALVGAITGRGNRRDICILILVPPVVVLLAELGNLCFG